MELSVDLIYDCIHVDFCRWLVVPFLVDSLKPCFMYFWHSGQIREQKCGCYKNLTRLGLPMLPVQGSLQPTAAAYQAAAASAHQGGFYQPAVSEQTGILSKLKGILGPGGNPVPASGPQIIVTGAQQGSFAPVLSLVSSQQSVLAKGLKTNCKGTQNLCNKVQKAFEGSCVLDCIVSIVSSQFWTMAGEENTKKF